MKGPLANIPKDWKSFLANINNKTNLNRLVLEEWQRTCMIFDIQVGNKHRLLDIKALIQIYDLFMCSTLLGIHTFTGCDSTGLFVRSGKAKQITHPKDTKELGSTVVSAGEMKIYQVLITCSMLI